MMQINPMCMCVHAFLQIYNNENQNIIATNRIDEISMKSRFVYRLLLQNFSIKFNVIIIRLNYIVVKKLLKKNK